jgi:hypothetical protein
VIHKVAGDPPISCRTKAPAAMITLRPLSVSSQTTLMRATAVTGTPVSWVILIANPPRAGGYKRTSGI